MGDVKIKQGNPQINNMLFRDSPFFMVSAAFGGAQMKCFSMRGLTQNIHREDTVARSHFTLSEHLVIEWRRALAPYM